MKRKRKEVCPSPPLIEDVPKRPKVHAQRKFAQNSNVNSPAITPIRELEAADLLPNTNVLPEPVELLPMKRPNTEDFLTFLCFRGTPILPSNLNFFNTASIVTDGQVHEIKGNSSPKNGPIDLAKCASTSADKPFIAFGVRKRADPIVISKQMERKRRHALALQALRRRYQEQKMAKIRALTISKLSEKTTNKTTVKTNTIHKTETVTKKDNITLQKTKVIATKHVKVTTQTLKTALRPKVKSKMCLRSFRGRIIQKELPFRGRQRIATNIKEQEDIKKKDSSKKSPDSKDLKRSRVIVTDPKQKIKTPGNSSFTRSSVANSNITRQKMKKRILLSTANSSKPSVKPKLRSSTLKSTVLSQRKAKQRLGLRSHPLKKDLEKEEIKRSLRRESATLSNKNESKLAETSNMNEKKELRKSVNIKKSLNTTRKHFEIKKNIDIKKQTEVMSEKKKCAKTKTEVNTTKEVVTSRLRSKGFEHMNFTKRKNINKNNDNEEKPQNNKNISKKSSVGDSKVQINKSEERRKQDDRTKEKQNIVGRKIQFDNQLKQKNEEKIKKEDIKKEKTIVVDKNIIQHSKNVARKQNMSKQIEESIKESNEIEESKNCNFSQFPKKDLKELVADRKIIPDNSSDSKLNINNLLKEGKTCIKPKFTTEKDKDIKILDNETKQASTREIKPKLEDQKNECVKISRDKDFSIKSTDNLPDNSIKGLITAERVFKTAENMKLKETIKKDLEIVKKKEQPLVIKAEHSFNVEKAVENLSLEETLPLVNVDDKIDTKSLHACIDDVSKSLTKEIKDDKPRKVISIEKKKLPMNAAVRKQELRRKITEKSDDKIPQRPSRKTKEAAAIYMELLSHKLVNDGIFDDDNVSIDSFPELPNVKRTERRENELKAKAKTASVKDKINKSPEKIIIDKTKGEKSNNPEKLDITTEKIEVPVAESNINEDKNKIENTVEDEEIKSIIEHKDAKKSLEKCKFHETPKEDVKSVQNKITEKSLLENSEERLKFGLRKRKSYQENFLEFSSDSDDEFLQEKANKLSQKKLNKKDSPEISEKRQTRGITQIFVESDTDTDESFYLDVKVPRTKKCTRSRNKTGSEKDKLEAEKNKKLSTKQKLREREESLDSDTNLKSLQLLSKLQGKAKKSLLSFSDSDEEPLSKLTADKSTKSCNESEECKTKKKSSTVPVRETKPKRECAKRPQNYLPMPSSSEDEEYFHGFTTTVKEDIVPKQPVSYVEALPPSLDLLEKELGRKGKVNMSNEQIEQWLKDSALAGSVVAKENDEMLKFGEKIPVERSPPTPQEVSEKVVYETLPVEVKNEEILKPELDMEKPTKSETKSSPGDRKIIFKKDKKEPTPTISAFSPENECSIYAFGDDIEETPLSTPFRRPSRRPSSTATSRSEDESSKNGESSKQGQFRKPPPQIEHSEDFRFFNIPQNPSSSKLIKKVETTMVPPANVSKKPSKLHLEKFLEPFDDSKYKVPSSPSASSGSSAKLSKKSIPKPRNRSIEVATPIYMSDFPKTSEPGKLVEAPVFHPTEQEFQDPLEYIERIRHKAEQFGICKIVPPSSFKPECKVSDEMRFTAYNQYVHKMLHRWGPNFKEFMAIKKYLATQNITLKQPPLIGGMEIDLPRLYQTVQTLGGLKEVIEKKKWPKVSDLMRIPKSAQDRVTKLDDIYCKYLLPYDTLSPDEREKLFDDAETEWAKRESKNMLKIEEKNPENSDDGEESDDEAEECIVKGRNMALSAFYRVARNTMAMHFKNAEPVPQEVEEEFWKYVTQKQNYICVHSASIDCGVWGYGFAVTKNSPFAKHAWNLKVLSNNPHSVLKSLGPAMGVTVPTLHVGMVFSACCWYRDPHGLPWIEYLHTGGSKIWYGVPKSTCDQFHAALKKLVPNYCRDKDLWLPSDTAMVPPNLLMENNVSLSRTVQEPGQFIVVFPKVFTSSISTGYVVSESVYFAPHYWLKTAKDIFNELKNSCEPSMFSLDKLLLKIALDPKYNVEVLRIVNSYLQDLYFQEKSFREKLRSLGKIPEEKIAASESTDKRKKKLQFSGESEFECDICRTNLYVSMVTESQNDLIYCLEHAIQVAEREPKLIESLKLQYNYNEEELREITCKINVAIEAKPQKKTPNKFAGMPTLLGK